MPNMQPVIEAFLQPLTSYKAWYGALLAFSFKKHIQQIAHKGFNALEKGAKPVSTRLEKYSYTNDGSQQKSSQSGNQQGQNQNKNEGAKSGNQPGPNK